MAPRAKTTPSKTPASTVKGNRTRGITKAPSNQQRKLDFVGDSGDVVAETLAEAEEQAAPVAVVAAQPTAVPPQPTAVPLAPLSLSEESELRKFDLIQKYGPCVGLSRHERYQVKPRYFRGPRTTTTHTPLL